MTKPDYTLRSVFLYSYPQHAGDSAMHAGSSGNARAPFIFSLLKGTIALSGIVKQTYSEQVVEYIKDRILKGELSPGDPVKEALIAQKLAISRAPVREALQILAREGLIVYEPQKGKRITALTAKEIRDSYFTGGVLEAAAVAAALPLYTAQDIDLMHRTVNRMKEVADTGAPLDSMTGLDNIFHETLFSRVDNPLLVELCRRSCQGISKFLLYRHWIKLFSAQEVYLRHKAVFDAVASGDPALTETTIRHHYTESGERMSNYGVDVFDG